MSVLGFNLTFLDRAEARREAAYDLEVGFFGHKPSVARWLTLVRSKHALFEPTLMSELSGIEDGYQT